MLVWMRSWLQQPPQWKGCNTRKEQAMRTGRIDPVPW
jgi:hypothetical protein